LNDEADFPIIAQMSQKTNQFNLTGKRYTDLEIKEIASRRGMIFSLSVKDKFGDSGLTGAAVITAIGNDAHIDNLFLSCRILGRKIEKTFMEQIIWSLREDGFENVTACYNKTPKNQSVAEFYGSMGFSKTGENETSKTYVYSLKKG
jgi:FkbH-like protein